MEQNRFIIKLLEWLGTDAIDFPINQFGLLDGISWNQIFIESFKLIFF